MRAAAAGVVCAVRFEGVSLKAAMPAALADIDDARDRALCEAICFEATRWCMRYERYIAGMLERPLAPSLRPVQSLLLVGLAQLEAMRLPDHAAISSTAEAARILRHPRHVGLVNAVLRRFQRERDALAAETGRDPDTRYSHPAWLVHALERDWGTLADTILQENNRAAPMWLRIHARRTTRSEYIARLAEVGIVASPSELAPQAVRLNVGVAVQRLPGWDEGLVSVQDLAAQLSAQALALEPEQRVLDACAAPGGKCAHLLEGQLAPAELLAIDLDPRRLQRVRDALARGGLHAELQAADATQPRDWWDGREFDRILLDAPCSGSGVIRRQPDIKLHRRASDLPGLVALQGRLLDALWPMLRTGGRLVYSTCSVLKDENERQIDAFLARTPLARPVPLPVHFGRESGGGRQRMPGEDGGDGFFHSALLKCV